VIAAVELQDDGTVVSDAVSVLDAVHVGPLELRGIRSHARAVLAADGSVTRASELSVANATVSGLPAALGDHGLVLPGSALPGSSAQQQALRSAGVEVTVLDARNVPDGVVAPTLEISTTRDLPTTGRQGTLTFVFGGALASVSGSASSPDSAATEPPDSLSARPLAVTPPTPSPRQATTPTAAPATIGTSPAPATAAVGSGRVPVAWDFYWVLIVAGVVLAGGEELVRLLGVRGRWNF
jgi:hypothetical protein